MESDHCAFWLPKKQRNCGFPRVPESQYCSQHANSESGFVPCPLDPRHKVQASKLSHHLVICNKAKAQLQITALPYYSKDIAVLKPDHQDIHISPKDWDLDETNRLIIRINQLYDLIARLYHERTGETLPLITVPRAPKPDKRQHIQSQVLVQVMETCGLLQTGVSYIEFGAGKGALSHYIAERTEAHHFLIERAPMRNKYDKLHKHTFTRLQADIADIDLRQVDLIGSVICVGKHVCGGATDLSIVSVLRSGVQLAGVVLATCCHHRCTISTFIGADILSELGVTEPEQVKLFKASSWGPSGAVRPEEGMEAVSMAKSEAGLKAKRIIDIARVLFLCNSGLSSRLFQYCDNSLTPENMVVVAWKTHPVSA